MMLSANSRPVQPAPLAKEDVIVWFRNAPGATRIDVLCGLLGSCVAFEIRFIGSVLETFGRKEFGQLREMTDRANKVAKRGIPLEDNVQILFQSILGKDDDVRRSTSAVSHNSSNTPISTTTSSIISSINATTLPSVATTNVHLNPNLSAKSSTSHHQLLPQPLSSVLAQETTQLNRPATAHKAELPLRPVTAFEPTQLRQQISRNHSPAVSSLSTPIPQPMVNGISAAGKRSNCSSEDETDSPHKPKDLRVLEYPSSRQKLVLYLSLLSSTNHDAALVYYALISQVSRTVGDSEWMEQQSEPTLEEVTLLYTLGIHHPAFSYEQRLMLSEILVKVRRELQRKKTQAYAQQVFSPVQVFEPQYGHGQVYFQMPPMSQPHLHSSVPPSLEHLGNPAPQHPQGNSGGLQGLPNSLSRTVPIVDTSRLPPPPTPQINFYQQQIPYPPYQTLGSSTHPQNPSYINAPPLATNIAQLSNAIRSNSPSNIPPPTLGNEGAVPTSANKGEKLPPPLYENIPVPVLDTPTNPNFQNTRPDKVSCFNCGKQGHLGIDCESASMEQMSHHLFRLNFEDNNNKNKPN